LRRRSHVSTEVDAPNDCSPPGVGGPSSVRHQTDGRSGPGTAPQTRIFSTLALWWLVPAAALLLVDVPICPLAGLLGWPCPGCGLTRAGLALLHGQFAVAWRFHPLVYLVVPSAAALGVKATVHAAARRHETGSKPAGSAARVRDDRLVSVVAGLGLALLLGVWLARALGALGGPVPVETYGQWLERVIEKR
jgi:hypothetical protein